MAIFAFSGCNFFGGTDGRDGQDLNIYDIYDAANAERAEAGLEQLSFLEFLQEYLNYNFEYDEDKNFQTVINRSLLSAVAVLATFGYSNSSDKSYAAGGVFVEVDKEAGNAYVLTNAHEIFKKDAYPQTAKSVSIYLYGNDIISAGEIHIDNVKIVNYALAYDLALLKIENSDLIKSSDVRAAVFSESENVYAGEKVFTVGYPGATGISVTTGIISKESELIALDFASNTGNTVHRVIRTDAGVNAGNSGGALFDSSGRIVGIINSKDPDAENENMGYALCGSYVKRLYKLMRDGYKATNGNYGIRCSVFPAQYGYDSKAYFDNRTGLTEIHDDVYVLESSGGFAKGDRIKHIKIVNAGGAVVEDSDVTRFYNIDDMLISARLGDKIIYTVSRGGEDIQLTFEPQFKNIS